MQVIGAGSGGRHGQSAGSGLFVGQGQGRPSRWPPWGWTDLATGAIRVSGGWGTTEDSDWTRFADAWTAAFEKHVARLSARAKEVA